MPEYKWPPMEKRRVMGKRTTRLDGMVKSTGRAKYSSDVNRPGMLYGVMLTCPHAHARVTAVDIAAARKVPGVEGVRILAAPGTEVQWAGYEIAQVVATSEAAARDGVRAIKASYEVLPHVVRENDLAQVDLRQTGPDWRIGDRDEVEQGDPPARPEDARQFAEH